MAGAREVGYTRERQRTIEKVKELSEPDSVVVFTI